MIKINAWISSIPVWLLSLPFRRWTSSSHGKCSWVLSDCSTLSEFSPRENCIPPSTLLDVLISIIKTKYQVVPSVFPWIVDITSVLYLPYGTFVRVTIWHCSKFAAPTMTKVQLQPVTTEGYTCRPETALLYEIFALVGVFAQFINIFAQFIKR